MTVYGDLLFLINFSMDFLCFYISCLLLHERLRVGRACISSVLGGAYSVIVLFLTVGRQFALAIDIVCCFLMCAIVFGGKGARLGRIIKACALYVFVSMLLGGIMTATFSILNRTQLFSGDADLEEGISVWIFALLAIVSGAATVFGGRFFRSSSKVREAVVEIENGEKRVRLRALSDSGNLVCDPISGKAVIIATIRSAREIIPAEFFPVFEDVSCIERMPVSVASRVRLIPSSTVSGSTLLPAIRVNKIKVISGKIEKRVDALVSFVPRDDLSGYDAVIPQDVLI